MATLIPLTSNRALAVANAGEPSAGFDMETALSMKIATKRIGTERWRRARCNWSGYGRACGQKTNWPDSAMVADG